MRRYLLPALVLTAAVVFNGYGQIDQFDPVATDDDATTTENEAVTVDVTKNDFDPDLFGGIDETTVDLNTSRNGIQGDHKTSSGTFKVNRKGVVTFTPENGFSGEAVLDYTVEDNAGKTSNVATITITVEELPNVVPVAANDNAATDENKPVTINVTANDTDTDGTIDPATVDLNTSAGGIQDANSTGQGNFAVNASGVVTYTPANDFSGKATLTYTVNDDDGATSNVATITITVNAAPVAANDNANTDENTPATVNILANDTDSDGTIDKTTVDLNTTTAGIQNTNAADGGDFAVNATGVVTFTPKEDFTGTVSIRYTVNDNGGATSNEATITVTVNYVGPPNQAPEITDFEDDTDTLKYEIGNGRPQQLTARFNARDADDETLESAEIGFRQQNYRPENDRLLFTAGNNIAGVFNEQTGILTLEGKAPVADYVKAVRSVKYHYVNAQELILDTRTVYVRLSDGKSSSETRERVIGLTDSFEDLDIPTGFTPNEDGANETWKISPRYGRSPDQFSDTEIRVYDKRGLLLYETTGLENRWNGMHNGQVLPPDTYYYTIHLKQNNVRYKGTVTILR